MNGHWKPNTTSVKNKESQMSNIVRALSLKYQSEIESARANIEVYMTNPAGIGEHPDIVQAVDSELVKLSTAEDKLKSLDPKVV